jgi:hypothetical protein
LTGFRPLPDERFAAYSMPALAQIAENRKQAFLVAVAAFAHLYFRFRALPGGLDKLPPQPRWQLACLFWRMCREADRAGLGLPAICRRLFGRNWWEEECRGYLTEMCDLDDRTLEPPEHADSVIVLLPIRVDRRRQIREGKAFNAIAGPPPESDRRSWQGAPVDAQRAKSHLIGATQKYSNLISGEIAASGNEDSCASRDQKYSAHPNKNNRSEGRA